MSVGPALRDDVGVLGRALAALAPQGLLVGCRRIETGDAVHILPREGETIQSRMLSGRDASGAGRLIAHRLLQQLGCEDVAILRGKAGEPTWPAGFVGSIAHDDTTAIAVVGRIETIRSVGVDIELATPLPLDLEPVVVTPRDRLEDCDPVLASKIAFVIKEAAYKASFPLDGEVLGFDDITVDVSAAEAIVANGRRFSVRLGVSTHVMALAFAT